MARDLDIIPTTLNQYFKQDTLQFTVLWKIIKALNYNFLASLAEYLHIPFETYKMKEMQKQLDENAKTIEKLEMQIETYKEVLKR